MLVSCSQLAIHFDEEVKKKKQIRIAMDNKMLTIIIWDVQHGNAIYIRTPNNTNIIHDLGSGSFHNKKSDFSPLLHLRNQYHVSRLEYVIITHPHKDHIGDIFNFDGFHPIGLCRPRHLSEDEIRQGNKPEDNRHLQKYIEIDKRYTHELNQNEKYWLPQNNGGVEVQSFVPKSCDTSNLNNHSIVTVVSYAKSKMILPGDNEPLAWKELLQDTKFQLAISGADVFLASHHGRESGFYRPLFDHFKPKLTVISDGPSNNSAVSSYDSITTGWLVHKRSGGSEKRKCITTRKDGVIIVKFGYNNNSKPFIDVSIA